MHVSVHMQGCVGIGERLIKGCKPKFVTGAPKQFASSVGVLFSGLSALFLLLAPEHGRAFKWIGVFWIVGLMGAVGLNGALVNDHPCLCHLCLYCSCSTQVESADSY